MKMNIKKIGLALVSVSLLSAAVSPTVIPAYAASTSKSKIVKIKGTKMTMKQFERKLKKAKIVNYTSKKKDHRVHQSKSNKNRHQNGQTRKYKSEKKKSRKNWKHNK